MSDREKWDRPIFCWWLGSKHEWRWGLLIALAMIVVGLLLGCAPAQAASTLHKEAVGTWCLNGNDETRKETTYLEFNGKCENPLDLLIVERTNYRGSEHTCRITAVKTRFDPNIIANTKEWGVPVSQVTSKCEGLDTCTWREQVTLYVSKGVLVLKNGRTWNEKGCQ
jgi:hypothetical protein